MKVRLVLLALPLVAAAQLATADQMLFPYLKPGLWEGVNQDGQKIRSCIATGSIVSLIGPAYAPEALKKKGAVLAVSGGGNSYRLKVTTKGSPLRMDIELTAPDGSHLVESNSVDVGTGSAPVVLKTQLAWAGACPSNLKPGQTELNGKLVGDGTN